MGKLVVSEFVTLDGVYQDPGGGDKTPIGGWAFQFNRGPEGDKFKLDELMASDALLLGRVTYEGFAAAWPNIKDEAGFADRMNGLPKYVVSTTLQNPTWNNTTVIKSNVYEQIRQLKARTAGDILVGGSGRLVQTLMDNDLVDEFRLMVYPVILGSGKRLFPEGTKRTSLRLMESKPIGDGIVILTYQPGGK